MAKFSGCYLSVKDMNESGKSEDDIVLDAMNLYKQKCGKTFVLKHCWLLLKNYPRFAAIFMGKRKAGGFDPSTPNTLHIDRRDLLSPNGEAPSTDSPPAHIRPQAAKSSKNEHAHSKGKEQALRANAKDTTDFAAATLKKAEQIAQQNTFSLFTLEDKNITYDLARQWLHLRPMLLPSKLPRLMPPTCLLLLGLESVPSPSTLFMHLHLPLHLHQHKYNTRS